MMPAAAASVRREARFTEFAGDTIGPVAGAAARHDLAAGDADVHVQITVELAAQIRHGIADRQRRAHRPFRVVAMRDRRAEHRHGAVADVLVDGAAEPLDQAIDEAEEASGQVVHRLGTELAS